MIDFIVYQWIITDVNRAYSWRLFYVFVKYVHNALYSLLILNYYYSDNIIFIIDNYIY